jgi:hypothetical protein
MFWEKEKEVNPAKEGIVSRKPIHKPWSARQSIKEYAPERDNDKSKKK